MVDARRGSFSLGRLGGARVNEINVGAGCAHTANFSRLTESNNFGAFRRRARGREGERRRPPRGWWIGSTSRHAILAARRRSPRRPPLPSGPSRPREFGPRPGDAQAADRVPRLGAQRPDRAQRPPRGATSAAPDPRGSQLLGSVPGCPGVRTGTIERGRGGRSAETRPPPLAKGVLPEVAPGDHGGVPPKGGGMESLDAPRANNAPARPRPSRPRGRPGDVLRRDVQPLGSGGVPQSVVPRRRRRSGNSASCAPGGRVPGAVRVRRPDAPGLAPGYDRDVARGGDRARGASRSSRRPLDCTSSTRSSRRRARQSSGPAGCFWTRPRTPRARESVASLHGKRANLAALADAFERLATVRECREDLDVLVRAAITAARSRRARTFVD